MGATNWPVYEESSVPGVLKLLDNDMKIAILDDYSRGYTEREVRLHLRIPLGWITTLYDLLKRISRDAILVQRGEYLETPGDPPSYNTAPTTSGGLQTYMQNLYSSELNATAVTKAMTEMIKWSNGMGNATYTYWKSKVRA